MRRFDLLPIAVDQSPMLCLTHRYREQAPSHIFDPIQSYRTLPMAFISTKSRP